MKTLSFQVDEERTWTIVLTDDRRVTWGFFSPENVPERGGGYHFSTIEDSLHELTNQTWHNLTSIQREAIAFLANYRTLTERALHKRRVNGG